MMKGKTKNFYLLIIIAGVVTFFIGISYSLFYDNNMFIGIFSGVGGAWIGVGALNLYKLKRKPNIIKKQEIAENDERNIEIRQKAAYSTFFVTLFGLVLLQIIFVVNNYTTASILTTIVLAIHVISLLVFLRHYNNKL